MDWILLNFFSFNLRYSNSSTNQRIHMIELRLSDWSNSSKEYIEFFIERTGGPDCNRIVFFISSYCSDKSCN